MQKSGGGGGGGGGGDIYNVQAAEILAKEALVSPLRSTLLYSPLTEFHPNPMQSYRFQLLPINEAAPIYEKLLATFPTAVSITFPLIPFASSFVLPNY